MKIKDKLFLPTEVEIPTEITNEEEISDWLSDEFGYCHKGFCLEMEERINEYQNE